jgi:hypothetical protein
MSPKASPRASRALLDYLNLGPGRSLPALVQRYKNQESPPTRALNTLRMWSSKDDWAARAASFDALEAQRISEEYRAHREALLQTGLALQHERIERLTTWFQKLDALTQSDEAIWIRQVKTLRLENGQFERVELRRFNDDLFRLLLGILQAIASEIGPSPSLPEKPQLELHDVHFDHLLPEEQTELNRLMAKVFA